MGSKWWLLISRRCHILLNQVLFCMKLRIQWWAITFEQYLSCWEIVTAIGKWRSLFSNLVLLILQEQNYLFSQPWNNSQIERNTVYTSFDMSFFSFTASTDLIEFPCQSCPLSLSVGKTGMIKLDIQFSYLLSIRAAFSYIIYSLSSC